MDEFTRRVALAGAGYAGELLEASGKKLTDLSIDEFLDLRERTNAFVDSIKPRINLEIALEP